MNHCAGCNLSALALLALTAQSAGAIDGLTSRDACDRAAIAAAANSEVPESLLLAITRVETGRSAQGRLHPWPWTLNLAGQGQWFETVSEAIRHAEDALNTGMTNMDIGCFQLNLRWHAKGFASFAEMFDPEANARYAALFLREQFDRTGNWRSAVAAYHSTNPEHATPYLEKVEAVLATLTEPARYTDPAPPPANRFPLLQGGLPGRMASLVPQANGVPPLFVAGP